MSRRPTSLFRGSELPRLLFLVAIVLAGWPMFLIFARSDGPEKPAPVVLPAAQITPVVADQGIEFQAIQDKTPIQIRESAAYALLLGRARETSAQALDKQARRDIFFTHLWERPELYRGVPVHLVGTAKKILTYEVAPTMSPGQRLYEIWFYSDENRSAPYVVVIQDPPPGLPVGVEVNVRIVVDGYFFKLFKYYAGDTARAAPMLVGRIHWPPAQAAAPSTLTELSRIPKQYVVAGGFVLLMGYVSLRVILQVRKAQALTRPRSALTSNKGELPAEDLAEWLQSLPAEIEEESAETHPPR